MFKVVVPPKLTRPPPDKPVPAETVNEELVNPEFGTVPQAGATPMPPAIKALPAATLASRLKVEVDEAYNKSPIT
jgi:hypothetical protein